MFLFWQGHDRKFDNHRRYHSRDMVNDAMMALHFTVSPCPGYNELFLLDDANFSIKIWMNVKPTASDCKTYYSNKTVSLLFQGKGYLPYTNGAIAIVV